MNKTPISRMESIRQGIILSLVSVIITVVALEMGVRLFLPVRDYLRSEATPLGLQRVAGQQGRFVFEMGTDVNSIYSINAQGWNAPYDYTGQADIAVIGDSQVEALYVPPGKAFPDLLEARLSEKGCPDMNTYRFGVSGAPLSSYYVVMQHIIETYHPRIIVINLVQNDFLESIEGVWGVGRYFWRVNPDDMTLDPPEVFVPDRYDSWRYENFALRRFIMQHRAIDEAKIQADQEAFTQAHSQPTADEVMAVTGWLIEQIQSLADEHDITLLWLPEVNSNYVYGSSDMPYTTYMPEVGEIIEGVGGTIVDPLPAFEADYAAHRQHFEFRTDAHWNENGHRVIAEATSDWIADHACGE